jgi:hypothetical protein
MKVKALVNFHASEPMPDGRSFSKYYEAGKEYEMSSELVAILVQVGQVEMLDKPFSPTIEDKELKPVKSVKGIKPKFIKMKGRK